jgi:dolichyl-phosphate beta-glucosyltransferase
VIALSIIIPAYNEEARLPKTLDSVIAYLRGCQRQAEIVVVDDGSRDGTVAVTERYAREHACIRLVRNPGNRGKGYAVRAGMLAAEGEWRLISDADLSAPIEELDKLLDAAKANRADVAIGSRAIDRSLVAVHQAPFREYSGRLFNLVMRVVTGLPFLDTQCGFKLYSQIAAKEIFPRQTLDGFSFDVEDLVIAKVRQLKTIEVAVRWSNVEGTKVGMMQGLLSFLDLARIRLAALSGRYSR